MSFLKKISLKKYLLAVSFIILIVVIFLSAFKAANFIKFYNFVTKPVISNFSVTQLPSVPGQPIHWIKTVNLSSVNNSGYLLAIPKGASNVKISTGSNKTFSEKAGHNISKADLSKLAFLASQSEESKNLAKQVAQEKATGFFASLFKLNVDSLFATVGEITLEEEAESTTESTLIDLAPVVEEVTGVEITLEDNIPPPPLEDSGTPPNLGGDSEGTGTTTEENISEPISTSTAEEVIATTTETTPLTPSLENEGEGTATTTDSVATTTASSTDVVVVEYETPAPVIAEAETETGKIVSISSTSTEQDVITNVLAFTNIPEIFKVGQENKIKIKWTNNGDQNVTFHAYDTNGNGKLDYVEWTVPHLSTQTFEIIFISKAFELDENKEIVNDIYDTVRYQDGTFAPIPATHYIRATFEKNLTPGKDMTIYAKGQGTITVFNENGSESIGEFTVNGENTYKIYPNYTDSAVYDLLFSGTIEVDYIVDPTTTLYFYRAVDKNWETLGNWFTDREMTTPYGGAVAPWTTDDITKTYDIVDISGGAERPWISYDIGVSGNAWVVTGTYRGVYSSLMNQGWIHSGNFECQIDNQYSSIYGGSFSGQVTNESNIRGGTFSGSITNGSMWGGDNPCWYF